jgi:lactate dehydrogenase-like 2-hydroxyacid dehydrogenase
MVNTKPRLVVTHRLPEAVERVLDERFEVRWNEPDQPLSKRELVARAADADGLLCTVTDRIGEPVLRAGKSLRIVANYGVGVDRIDLQAARAAGIVVTNTPDVLTDCTADLTMALILMVLRRLPEGEQSLREGRWEGWRPTYLLGRRATGKTLGIVGMGRIGRAVAERAHFGFGMRILYTGRHRTDSVVEARLEAERVPLETLLAQSDVVSLHCPATPETHHLIDRERLRLMRSDAVLINTARGALVDEEALAEALTAGTIAGTGLDVFANEPEVTPALRASPNTVLLPHLGSGTVETRTAMGMCAVENLTAFFAGREPPNRVA